MCLIEKKISSRDDFFCISGSSNTYFITCGDSAICFDPGNHIDEEVIKSISLSSLESVFLTSSDRSSCYGLYNIPATNIFAGEKTIEFLKSSYEFLTSDRPGRYNMVDYNQKINWHGWKIKVIASPGLSLDSMSYFLEKDGFRFCISGKSMETSPKDLFLLQHERKGHKYESIKKISNADLLLPSFGEFIPSPAEKADKYVTILKELYIEYSKTSALNFYFPKLLNSENFDPIFARLIELPDFIEYLPNTTSFVIKSESGHCFLADINFPESLNYPDENGLIPDFT